MIRTDCFPRQLLQQAEAHDAKLRVMAAISQRTGSVVGTVKIEPFGAGDAEIGMFAVDPDMQVRFV